MSDAFDQLAQMATARNGLYGARVQAEQRLRHDLLENGRSYTSTEVMRQAWASLLPEQHDEAMEDLLEAYHAQATRIEREEEMNRAAREEGKTFLEHDDLEVISYSCFAILDEDGEAHGGIPEDGMLYVEIALLGRLIDEIELLRAKLRQAGVDAA